MASVEPGMFIFDWVVMHHIRVDHSEDIGQMMRRVYGGSIASSRMDDGRECGGETWGGKFDLIEEDRKVEPWQIDIQIHVPTFGGFLLYNFRNRVELSFIQSIVFSSPAQLKSSLTA
jgi:hypothetical protein